MMGSILNAHACHFGGNVAPKGSQIMNKGSRVTLGCLLGQFNDAPDSVEYNTTFTGCPKFCLLAAMAPRRTSSTVNAPGLCEPGYYCPQGSTNPKSEPCPAGRFIGVPGGSDMSNCAICGESFYCKKAALYQQPCPQGSYGNTSQLQSQTCSGKCPPGYFCPTQTNQPQHCPPGTYSLWGNATCTAWSVLLDMLRNQKHRLSAESVCRECPQDLHVQHCAHSVLWDNIKTREGQKM